MIGRILGRLLGVLGLLVAALLVGIHVRYGGGAAFPDRTGQAQMSFSSMEVVATLPSPPGNVAVAPDGRVFATLHPEARPRMHVVEIVQGEAQPWPSEAFQGNAGEPRHFRDPLGIRIDRQNRLWVLDPGHHGFAPGRLLAFDLKSGEVVHEFEFPRLTAGIGSHLNDFQVSPDGKFVYIADASLFRQNPALIVYDVANGTARRVLEHHASVTPERFVPTVQGRRMVAFGLVAIRPGVDSITLDERGEWLYFAPVTSQQLWRIKTADLRNVALGASDLADRVESYADKTMSDGITIDNAGTIYITDPEHSAIVALKPDKQLETLIKDDKLRWPDGFSFGPDGWLYVTCSSLHQIIGMAPWTWKHHAPYQIYRFKPGAKGVPGH